MTEPSTSFAAAVIESLSEREPDAAFMDTANADGSFLHCTNEQFIAQVCAARRGATLRAPKGRTAILLPGNAIDLPILAVAHCGYNGVVPINPILPLSYIRSILSQAGASEIVVSETFIEAIENRELIEGLKQDFDIVPVSQCYIDQGEVDFSRDVDHLFLHTSGSTGCPRLVAYTTDMILGMHASSRGLFIPEDSRFFLPIPMFSAGGLIIATMLAPFCGASLLILGGKGFADPEIGKRLPEIFTSWQPDALFSIPFLLNQMAGLRPFMAPEMKAVLSGGAMMSDQFGVDIAKKYDTKHIHAYGSTELGFVSMSAFYQDGRKSPVELLVEKSIVIANISDDGEVSVMTGQEPGEIMVRDPNISELGPYADPKPSDVWSGHLHTSDYGYIDEHGCLVIRGRLSDIVKYKGRRIGMSETEEAASKLTDGSLCVCIACPDAKTNESIVMFTESTRHEPESLKELLADVLSDPGKVPSLIVRMDVIPRAGMGKPDKSALFVKSREAVASKMLADAGISAEVTCSGSIREGVSMTVKSTSDLQDVEGILSGLFAELKLQKS